jgi:general secretion pathway protein E/type IV pilus assembly protein PilB
MLHGEAVVMRLLRQSATLRGMGELGMDPRELKSFRRVLALPHGIVLVTGPTGSGKTSTLYTALNEINDAVRKIITIEDPIEYQLKRHQPDSGLGESGLTFARGLRSMLRHDPDVILVGEIRDRKRPDCGASFADRSLGVSTLHTNDAPGALTRLVDMGVEPYLVASSLEAVLAHGSCASCALVQTRGYLSAGHRVPHGVSHAAGTRIFRAVGCRECRQTGYHGRRAIFEWMDSSNEIRQLILKNCSSDQSGSRPARRNARPGRGWLAAGTGRRHHPGGSLPSNQGPIHGYHH